MAKTKTKSKTFKVLDNEGNHEYTIRIKKTKGITEYALHRSNDTDWSNPKEHILSLMDDGNCVWFSGIIDGAINYEISTGIRILTNIANVNERYTIVKEKVKLKL